MKIKSPKFGLPGVQWPKPKLPKLGLTRMELSRFVKSRRMVIGASALALLGAGGLAWFFVRPMIGARQAPAREIAAATPEKATETPQKEASAGDRAAERKDDRKEEAKAGYMPEAAPEGAEAAHEKPADNSGKSAAAPLPAQAPPGEPELLIRQLQDLQEHVAAGDAAAFAEMPRLLRAIARKFVDLPPETWSQRKNARALILYLLSGGGSGAGRKILGEHTFAGPEQALVKGAIAYLENVEGADRDFLLRLDPRSLDLDLAAQVAFVQANLLTGVDRRGAIERLDLARLLAPGGLVEEAALRREVALLSETTEFDKFANLARQYWQRYRASPYADNFLRQFMLSLARVSQSIKLSEWTQLSEFIDSLSPETRRSLYLAMAQTAAVVGNDALAAMAAQNVLDLAPADSVDRQRALLFRAAARLGHANFVESRSLLRDLDKLRLPPGDQPLYDAVTLAAARIFRAPEQNFTAPPPGSANEADASMARAENIVKEADNVLASATKTMERKSR